MSKENLELWDSMEKTDPSFTKKVVYGKRNFTAIDAYYQFKTATKKFGMYGDGWGVSVEKFSFHDNLLLYEAEFYFRLKDKKYEFPIASSILWRQTKEGKIDDECVKKVKTDALTKGFSLLGMNADVFLGKFDDNRYVEQMQKEFANAKHTRKSVVDLLLKSGISQDEVKEFCHKAVGSQKASTEWTEAEIDKIADAWKKEIEKPKETKRIAEPEKAEEKTKAGESDEIALI